MTKAKATRVVHLAAVAARSKRAEVRTWFPAVKQAPDESVPVVPGHESLYDVTYRILKDHPNLTPEELATYLDEL